MKRKITAPTQPPAPGAKFGANWKTLIAQDDDWGDNCRSNTPTAFETTTERGFDQ